MTVEFVDPRPPTMAGTHAFVPVMRPRSGDTLTIGLLANGFPDSEAFLACLAAELVEIGPTLEWQVVTKARPPDPLTDAQLATLAACDAVVAAYGH